MVLREEGVDGDEAVRVALAAHRGAVEPSAAYESLYAQRPRMYHFAQCPLFSWGLTSDWIQVPGGVFEFQDETSSLNGKFIG